MAARTENTTPAPEQPSLADDDPTIALTAGFSATARALFSVGTPADTLQRIVDLAVETVDGCDYAGVFLLRDGSVTTPVRTDPLVVGVDALQHQLAEGPCLDAINHGGVFYAGDLADDSRWLSFGPRAVEAGIRSALALHLSANGDLGALNLYARYPHAFGAIDRAKALLLSVLAGAAISSARTHADDTKTHADDIAQVENLRVALITREVIGQAQGILIERERITADQAFDVLRRASQHLNIKLRDIAQKLVDTGEDPDTGPSAP